MKLCTKPSGSLAENSVPDSHIGIPDEVVNGGAAAGVELVAIEGGSVIDVDVDGAGVGDMVVTIGGDGTSVDRRGGAGVGVNVI